MSTRSWRPPTRKEASYRLKFQTSERVEQRAMVLALPLGPSINGQTPFASEREQARALLPPERLQQLCHHLARQGSLDEGAFAWRGEIGDAPTFDRLRSAHLGFKPVLNEKHPASG